MWSDGDRDAGFHGDFDLAAHRLRQWLVMLDHAFHYEAEYVFDILQRLCAGQTPRGCALCVQGGTIRVPAIFVRFHDNIEGVGLHGLLLVYQAPSKMYSQARLSDCRYASDTGMSDGFVQNPGG